MGKDSKIEWTDHSFNAWTGCSKISPGCQHCYAETWAKRSGRVVWGPKGKRIRTSESYWRQPLKWNAVAAKAGVRAKVFCSSLADVFDDHPSIMPEWRVDLWSLISRTPHLDWLLLTKRPENFERFLFEFWGDGPWRNVWLGVTVENQEEADKRIPILLTTPAVKQFLSVEPMLGPVDIRKAEAVGALGYPPEGHGTIDWVICGGESGPKARPMHPDWPRSLRDQCVAAGVPFMLKQWGEYAPAILDAKDGEPEPWRIYPDGVRKWSLSEYSAPRWSWEREAMVRVGKKEAGCLLDGREWKETPDHIPDAGKKVGP